MGDGLLCTISTTWVACLKALDGSEQALGDGIIAERLGQEQAHRAGIDGVAKHAAAHAGFGLDDSHGFLMHSKEPMSEHYLLCLREILVVWHHQDLVDHRR